jgi:hypothetical protein
VLADGTVRTESLSVLKCVSDDPSLRDYFVRVLGGVVRSLPPEPREEEIAAAVTRLVELFRALEGPGRASLQGTWCELLLIVAAPRVRQAVVAWHADPGARHDFAAGVQRLEVKSALGGVRSHHFALEQLRSSEDAQVVIASFLLEEDRRGPSIDDLWRRLESRSELGNDARERVARVLARSLGRDWREATDARFSVEHALDHLRFYDANAVPTVSPDVPPGVDEVRFRAELTNVSPLSRSAVRRRGGLFEALLAEPGR